MVNKIWNKNENSKKPIIYRFNHNYSLILYIKIYISHSEMEPRNKRSIIYPQFSVMGLFAAIAVPVDIMDNSVFFSYNFEGVYYVPRNLSELEDMALFIPVTREKRSLDRTTAYSILEDQLSRLGYPGRSCLLRAICEISHIPLSGNGVLSDIAHVIFTPSTSIDENLPIAFYKAEKLGQNGDCNYYAEKCPSSVMDDISMITPY